MFALLFECGPKFGQYRFEIENSRHDCIIFFIWNTILSFPLSLPLFCDLAIFDIDIDHIDAMVLAHYPMALINFGLNVASH